MEAIISNASEGVLSIDEHCENQLNKYKLALHT